MLTIEGYQRLKSGKWTVAGIFIFFLGFLSDVAQLVTTYFDPESASYAFLSQLPIWGFVIAFASIVVSIVAIATRSRLCAFSAGYLPYLVFATVVFAVVFAGQRIAFSEEAVQDGGGRKFINAQGEVTETNSIIGYFLHLNKKIDKIEKDVGELKTDVKQVSETTVRIEKRLDEKYERLLDIAEAGLAEKDKANARLKQDLRQLLVSILQSDVLLDELSLAENLRIAYQRLEDLRQNRLSFEESNPEINHLLREADEALQSGPNFSLEDADEALKAADAKYAAYLESETQKTNCCKEEACRNFKPESGNR